MYNSYQKPPHQQQQQQQYTGYNGQPQQQHQQYAAVAASRSSAAIPIMAPSNDDSISEASTSNASAHTTPSLNASSVTPLGPPGLSSPVTNNAGSPNLRSALSARAASAAVFVPKRSNIGSEADGLASRVADAKLEDKAATGSANASPRLSARAPAHIPSFAKIVAQDGSGTPSGAAMTPSGSGQGWDDGPTAGAAFDPTYTGPIPPNAASQPARPAEEASVQRAFNPYANMSEYGETLGPDGVPLPLGVAGGMMGTAALDYYGGSVGPSRIRQPLQYHLYAPPLPHVSNLHPAHLSAHAYFQPPGQREDLQRKNEALLTKTGTPPELGGPKLPEELHVYHSLVPLEHSTIAGANLPSGSAPPAGTVISPPPALVHPSLGQPGTSGATSASGDSSRVFGYRSHCYKATCTLDGKAYVLRRLEGFRLQHETAISLVERWRRIRHPSIVSVREAFTTRGFGDQSIVFVYDYHPLATTLHAEHLVAKPPQPDRRTGRYQVAQTRPTERTLWSYLCQLSSALRSIHAAGLAARCIEPSKILKTGQNRIRLNCCSIFDVIAYDPRAAPNALAGQQADDLVNFGKLLITLGCSGHSALQDLPKALDTFGRTFSADLKNVVIWLLGKPSPNKTAEELTRLLGPHFAEETEAALNNADLLESSLMKELENARLVRLLCKFGLINERPEFDHDPRWSETGDRYIVKLFRDHVFHAVDEVGRPVVDLSYILTHLNKLDVGVDERITLASRDEQSCLVVSYREIKNCIESSFQDLSRTR